MKKINSLVKHKAQSLNGETLTETLISLLIVALAMVMLAGSIVSASKVNKKVEDADTQFRTVTESGSSNLVSSDGTGGTVTITYTPGTSEAASQTVDVTVYQTSDKNSYVYYEESK